MRNGRWKESSIVDCFLDLGRSLYSSVLPLERLMADGPTCSFSSCCNSCASFRSASSCSIFFLNHSRSSARSSSASPPSPTVWLWFTSPSEGVLSIIFKIKTEIRNYHHLFPHSSCWDFWLFRQSLGVSQFFLINLIMNLDANCNVRLNLSKPTWTRRVFWRSQRGRIDRSKKKPFGYFFFNALRASSGTAAGLAGHFIFYRISKSKNNQIRTVQKRIWFLDYLLLYGFRWSDKGVKDEEDDSADHSFSTEFGRPKKE